MKFFQKKGQQALPAASYWIYKIQTFVLFWAGCSAPEAQIQLNVGPEGPTKRMRSIRSNSKAVAAFFSYWAWGPVTLHVRASRPLHKSNNGPPGPLFDRIIPARPPQRGGRE